MAPQLEAALGISDTEIGLLVTVSQLAAAVAMLPIGVLADRNRRQRLIWISILVWAAAIGTSGLAVSYPMLLVSRVGLGVVTASAGPPVSSLVGDFFAPGERARVYGLILGGDLVGSGIGLVLSGELAVLSWRVPFLVLSVVSVGVALCIARLLPEPARGGQRGGASRTPVGGGGRGTDPVADATRVRGVRQQVPGTTHPEPVRVSWPQAIRYVLSIPTNLYLVAASALGYNFLAGVRTPSSSCSFGGATALPRRLAPAWLRWSGWDLSRASSPGPRRGLVGRPWAHERAHRGGSGITAPGYAAVRARPADHPAPGRRPALLHGRDRGRHRQRADRRRAARHHELPSLGRAESVRSFIRTTLQAIAPLTIGFLADLFGGSALGGAGSGGQPVAPHHAEGLDLAFLVMLVPLAAAAVLLLPARRSYPTDVATAASRA